MELEAQTCPIRRQRLSWWTEWLVALLHHSVYDRIQYYAHKYEGIEMTSCSLSALATHQYFVGKSTAMTQKNPQQRTLVVIATHKICRKRNVLEHKNEMFSFCHEQALHMLNTFFFFFKSFFPAAKPTESADKDLLSLYVRIFFLQNKKLNSKKYQIIC